MPAFSPLVLVSPWRLWRDKRISGIVSVVAGLIMILLGVLYELPLVPIRAWPTTEGTIVSSAVRPTTEYGRQGPIPSSAVDVTYEYRVDGETLTGSRFTYEEASPVYHNPDDAVQLAAQYPPGQTVAVHYDPANPQTSLLQIGFGTSPVILLAGLGLFFIVFGIAILIVFRKRPAEPER